MNKIMKIGLVKKKKKNLKLKQKKIMKKQHK